MSERFRGIGQKFNAAKEQFDTARTNVTQRINRAKTDLNGVKVRFDQARDTAHNLHSTFREGFSTVSGAVSERVDQIMENLSPFAVRSIGVLSQALANTDLRNFTADITGTIGAYNERVGDTISTIHTELTSPIVPDGHAPGVLSIAAKHLRDHAPSADGRYGIHSTERLLAALENDHLSLYSRCLLGISSLFDDETMTHAQAFGTRTVDTMNSIFDRNQAPQAATAATS
jgi:hypothetical protein